MNRSTVSRRSFLGLAAGGSLLSASSLRSMAQVPEYDLLLRGGHLIDPRINLSAPRDVAIQGGRIAAIADRIDPAHAAQSLDVAGLYVTPGLIDPHVHIYAGTGERNSYAGDRSVY